MTLLFKEVMLKKFNKIENISIPGAGSFDLVLLWVFLNSVMPEIVGETKKVRSYMTFYLFAVEILHCENAR